MVKSPSVAEGGGGWRKKLQGTAAVVLPTLVTAGVLCRFFSLRWLARWFIASPLLMSTLFFLLIQARPLASFAMKADSSIRFFFLVEHPGHSQTQWDRRVGIIDF